MGLITSLMHTVSGYTRGIPEWAPHDHDSLSRNVPVGYGVESKLGMRWGWGRRWRRAYRSCGVPFARVPYTPYTRVAWYPPAYSGWGMLNPLSSYSYSSFNGIPYNNGWTAPRTGCGTPGCSSC